MSTSKLTWPLSSHAVSALSSSPTLPQSLQLKLPGSTIWVSLDFVLFSNFVSDGKRIDPKRAEKRNAKIFCGGLKSDFDDEAIKAFFAEHGEIELYER